ncbi:MAG: histidine--tRNA ligase [Syntrophorhabdales bacterium]|jgi:histidyl-tRNA synthetase
MEHIKALRGFRDIYAEEIERFTLIESASRTYLQLLGYREMEIPILEKTELFKRSIGDTTDIVEKEMFTFADRSGDSVTLRPEATAGLVRAYLQTSLYAKERTSRLFTTGPMFRHERPQKGRFRQFYQMDVEVFGIVGPMADAELIWMIFLILGDLRVTNYTIEINSVGCAQCRDEFRKVLVAFLESRKEALCEDCAGRLDRNPLRIFDCKNDQCAGVIREAPVLFDYLCDACRDHFDRCLAHLGSLGVPFVVNKRLVRGLDYYTRTVFEVTSSNLGAQNTFAAGGRYDNLVGQMGGPSVAGCGFAIGMERLALLIDKLPAGQTPLYFLAAVGERAAEWVIPLLRAFVLSHMPLAYAEPSRSLKSQMKYGNSLGADYVLILADEEVSRGVILVRDMKDGTQRELPLDAAALPGLVRG